MFSDHFDTLILKIIFKNKKKYHFNVFLNKKYFEKQPQPYSQTDPIKIKEKRECIDSIYNWESYSVQTGITSKTIEWLAWPLPFSANYLA
jgi:hypothetical protein